MFQAAPVGQGGFAITGGLAVDGSAQTVQEAGADTPGH